MRKRASNKDELREALSAELRDLVVDDNHRASCGADRVAARLGAAGAQGRRSNAFHCPLARYLSDRLGYPVMIGSRAKIHVPDMAAITVDLPPAVDAFVNRFDNRYYPELYLPERVRTDNE